jgi:hypothetical protein
MPNKSIPTIGDPNWGTPLNAHLAQLQNPTNGGINSFEQFSGRPTTLTADDQGKTYLYTQTGNLHQWTGTTWKVLNESVINVKDYGAIGDGITDDTVAIRLAINQAKSTISLSTQTSEDTKALFIPHGVFIVSGSLEVTGLEIFGNKTSWIKATEAEFDIFVSVSASRFRGFSINGGWRPGADLPNQKGNAIYVSNPVFGDVRIDSVYIIWVKENGIKLEKIGYANISACVIRACGLHGIYLYGTDTGANGTTTVVINNSTAVSDNPYGYGVKIENCYNITLDTVICENNKGFCVSRGFRTINFLNCYQEKINGEKFLTWADGANGYNMNIIGNFSVIQTIDYNAGVKHMNAFGNTMGDVDAIGVVSGGVASGPTYGMVQGSKNGNDNYYNFNRLETQQRGFEYTPLTLGTYKIWVDDSGRLRIKNGQPTSDTDGAVVGSQV